MRFMEEKSKDTYLEEFRKENQDRLKFLKTGQETHRKALRRLERETEEEKSSIAEFQGEIDSIEAKLNNPDAAATRKLFAHFRSCNSYILTGPDSLPGGRFGLKTQQQVSSTVSRPVSVEVDGRRETQMRESTITKFRNNQGALSNFQDYLRAAGNWKIEDLSFEQLRDRIQTFYDKFS